MTDNTETIIPVSMDAKQMWSVMKIKNMEKYAKDLKNGDTIKANCSE